MLRRDHSEVFIEDCTFDDIDEIVGGGTAGNRIPRYKVLRLRLMRAICERDVNQPRLFRVEMVDAELVK